ncbi:hypothetical protein [Paraglaciecola sp. MB-3u-78]|uniref:hypothetical protein n=1 Tax=Paraglaciecola sp. MB-3u-78 TaxID=2058332 RepID=UPI0012FEE46D|nr:hypothetical protein [Paraglaciecola sp. MB-3u-78]
MKSRTLVKHDFKALFLLVVTLAGMFGSAVYIVNNWTGQFAWMNDPLGVGCIILIFTFFKYQSHIKKLTSKE